MAGADGRPRRRGRRAGLCATSLRSAPLAPGRPRGLLLVRLRLLWLRLLRRPLRLPHRGFLLLCLWLLRRPLRPRRLLLLLRLLRLRLRLPLRLLLRLLLRWLLRLPPPSPLPPLALEGLGFAGKLATCNTSPRDAVGDTRAGGGTDER